MSTNPVLGTALHLLQYFSKAALVKASAYSSTLPALMLVLYNKSATNLKHRIIAEGNSKEKITLILIVRRKWNGCVISKNFLPQPLSKIGTG